MTVTSPVSPVCTPRTPTRSMSTFALDCSRWGVPFLFTRGRVIIGSDADAEISLPSDGVAHQHCLIVAGPTSCILKAWDSRTWVNDYPVKEVHLHVGDRLTVGPLTFQFRLATPDEVLSVSDPVANENTFAHLAHELPSPVSPPPTESSRSFPKPAVAVDRPAVWRKSLAFLEEQRTEIEKDRARLAEESQRLRSHTAAREEELSRQMEQLQRRSLDVEMRLQAVEVSQTAQAAMRRELERREEDLIAREDALAIAEQSLALDQNTLVASRNDHESRVTLILQEHEALRKELEDQQASLDQRRQAISRQESDLQNRLRDRDQQQSLLNEKQQELADRMAAVVRDQERLSLWEQQLARSEAELASRTSRLQERETLVVARLQELESREQGLNDRELALVEFDEGLALREAELAETEAVCTARIAGLDERESALKDEHARIIAVGEETRTRLEQEIAAQREEWTRWDQSYRIATADLSSQIEALTSRGHVVQDPTPLEETGSVRSVATVLPESTIETGDANAGMEAQDLANESREGDILSWETASDDGMPLDEREKTELSPAVLEGNEERQSCGQPAERKEADSHAVSLAESGATIARTESDLVVSEGEITAWVDDGGPALIDPAEAAITGSHGKAVLPIDELAPLSVSAQQEIWEEASLDQMLAEGCPNEICGDHGSTMIDEPSITPSDSHGLSPWGEDSSADLAGDLGSLGWGNALEQAMSRVEELETANSNFEDIKEQPADVPADIGAPVVEDDKTTVAHDSPVEPLGTDTSESPVVPDRAQTLRAELAAMFGLPAVSSHKDDPAEDHQPGSCLSEDQRTAESSSPTAEEDDTVMNSGSASPEERLAALQRLMNTAPAGASVMPAQAEPAPPVEDDDSVSAYMARLLGRYGRKESSEPAEPAANDISEARAAEETSTEMPPTPVRPPRSLEDQEACRARLQSLRELANASTRKTLRTSLWKRTRQQFMGRVFLAAATIITGTGLVYLTVTGRGNYQLQAVITLIVGLYLLVDLARMWLKLEQRTKIHRTFAPHPVTGDSPNE